MIVWKYQSHWFPDIKLIWLTLIYVSKWPVSVHYLAVERLAYILCNITKFWVPKLGGNVMQSGYLSLAATKAELSVFRINEISGTTWTWPSIRSFMCIERVRLLFAPKLLFAIAALIHIGHAWLRRWAKMSWSVASGGLPGCTLCRRIENAASTDTVGWCSLDLRNRNRSSRR